LIEVRDVAGGATLRVRVAPRASRDALGGERDGALLVRLTAPPVDGAANAALTRFLARRLRIPPSSVTVVQGQKGREKVVLLAGTAAAAVRAAVEAPSEGEDEGGRRPRR
jgi:uncharacterized protein (TIGR00251 family)